MNELAQRVGAALKERGLMLVTAESCTGGWVAMAADRDRRELRLVRARLRHLLERRQA